MEGAASRQEALDDARAALANARTDSTIASDLADAGLLDAWADLSTSEKRRLMHGLLERVTVSKAEGRGDSRQLISERAEIILRGGTVLADA